VAERGEGADSRVKDLLNPWVVISRSPISKWVMSRGRGIEKNLRLGLSDYRIRQDIDVHISGRLQVWYCCLTREHSDT
jgi:hypothetical protein